MYYGLFFKEGLFSRTTYSYKRPNFQTRLNIRTILQINTFTYNHTFSWISIRITIQISHVTDASAYINMNACSYYHHHYYNDDYYL